MALQGSVTTTSSHDRSVTLNWTATQSVANNQSTISWTLVGSGNYKYWVRVSELKITIDGTQVYYRNSDNHTDCYPGTQLAGGTTTITHKSDGTRSFNIKVEAGIYDWAINCSGEQTFTLDTIPRASTITSVSNVTLGSKCGVTFTPASTSFQYNIKFSLGSWSVNTGRFTPGTTSSFTYGNYTIPNNSEVLSQIPSSTTASMTATLTTYNSSGTQIGSTSSKTFTVTVPSDIKPTVGTITLTPQTYSYLIQNKNTVKVSVSGCSAGTGSNISSYTFSGPSLSSTTTSTSVTSGIISSYDEKTYTVTVTDARGRTASKTASITCCAYATPSITLNAYRVASSSGTTEDDSGTYMRCTYNLSYSSVNNSNDVTVKLYYKKNTASSWSSTTVLTDSKDTSGKKVLSSIAIDSTYEIYATITDNYSGSSESNKITVFSAERVLNVRANKSGIAFGKMADTDDMVDSKWPIRTDEPEQTMQNFSYRGNNLISSTTKDTVENWNNQGNLATTFYTKTGQINGQPSQYGFLLNFSAGIGGKEMHNLWFTQPNGDVSHRGGNGDGICDWRKFLDSSNYTSWVSPKPVDLTNNLSTATYGTNGTITLNQSVADFKYLEIFYTDNTSGNGTEYQSTRIYSPNGKSVQLSLCEAGYSNGARVYIRTSIWAISGTTMTHQRSSFVQIESTSTTSTLGAATIQAAAAQYIKICKVLGYK